VQSLHVTEKACEFSWEVQAVRHDPFYDSQPMNVVEDKEPDNVGTLRHEKQYKEISKYDKIPKDKLKEKYSEGVMI